MGEDDPAIDELTKQLEAALCLAQGQNKNTAAAQPVDEIRVEDTSKIDGKGPQSNTHFDDSVDPVSSAVVAGEKNDAESVYSVPDNASEFSSSSESDSDAAQENIYIGPAIPLRIHKPVIVDGVDSAFENGISTLEAIAKMIKSGSVKKIVIMAGAGISTDAGIPDFRSPKTGLYANLQKYKLPYPEAIFSIDYFRRYPKPFYVLAKELYPGQFIPTTSHFFVKLLAQKGLLKRHYTQNIDCLERVAGIDSEHIVEAHGSFHMAHCIKSSCNKEYSQGWVKEMIMQDKIPRCASCKSLVKPDITFFGEGLPSRFFNLLEDDFSSCDLLIVMGTSLLVQPFASLINEVKAHVPRLLINRMRVGETKKPNLGFDFDGKYVLETDSSGHRLHRDALVLGDCDEACVLLADLLGWKDELLELRSAFMADRKLGRK